MIGLGILGCADIAVRKVLPAAGQNPGIKTTVVASRDKDKARRVADRFGADAVRGYQGVLDRPDVDAVYIPLPPAMHAEWVERALRAGKHVLAEKPLTTDHRATSALVALAAATRRVLMENYMFLQHGQHRRIRRMLADGTIGEPRDVRATFAIPPRPAGDIRHRADLGGGALFDLGGYPVRAALLLLGTDLRVAGAFLRRCPRLGVDVGGGALLVRSDGVTAHLSFGMEHLYTSSYDVLGSAGRLGLSHAFTPPAEHVPVARLEQRNGARDVVMEAEDQCAATLAAFVAAVDAAEAGDRTAPDPDPAIVRQAELIDHIRRLAVGADVNGGRQHE